MSPAPRSDVSDDAVVATTSNDDPRNATGVDEPGQPRGTAREPDLTAPVPAPAEAATPAPAASAQSERWQPARVVKPTRISGTWVAVVIAAIVLIFLLVFILQNLASVTVTFMGLSGTLPLGVALLFAAIAGALLVALVGAARIMQLRRRVRRIGNTPRVR
jgi:uncharacterized integral membrane protein